MARRTKEEAEATRQHILDKAEAEFHRRGMAGTSLQDIARAAGLTRGAIYWHFANKLDLFHAMLQRAALPLEREIDRSADPALDDPLGHIRRSYLAALRTTVSDPHARRVFEIALHKVEYAGDGLAVRDRRLAGVQQRLRHVERGLKRAGKLGQIELRAPARHAALGLHSLVGGLIQNWLLDPRAFDLLRVGTSAVDAYLDGLKTAAPPTKRARRT